MSCDDVTISIQNISKYFEIYEKPEHRLWQMLWRGRKKFFREFFALSDISFEVKRGECVGIIGRNGAGKSTLLQIVTGTLTPSTGTIAIKGRVAALLELGSGFNPEFSGRDNVYMNASILGLSKEEIDAKYDQIVAFADIGDFISQPVKSYSSGMVVRLAFAVIAHVDADVLIIDEALAVGDAFFTQKCMRFLRRFIEEKTVLFVSHDTAAVNSLCNRAVMLENGRIKMIGTPKAVTEKYLEEMYESMQGKSDLTPANVLSADEINACYRDMRLDFINSTSLRNDIELIQFTDHGESDAFGKGGARITRVLLCDLDGKPLAWVIGGEMVQVRICCTAQQDLFSPIIGFMIRNKFGQDIFGDNTFLVYQDTPQHFYKGEQHVAVFVFRMPILPSGEYSMNAAIAEGTQADHIQHHWVHDALIFHSHSTSCSTGLAGIPMKSITIESAD